MFASTPESLVQIQNNFTELFLIIPSTKFAQMYLVEQITCQVHLCRIISNHISIDRSTSVESHLIIFPVANRVDPDQAALIWVCSVCKSVKRHLYEVKG